MKLSPKFAETLLELIEKQHLPYSQFSQEPLLKQLADDGVVHISGRRQKTVQLHSPEFLQDYLENHFGIHDLETYISVLSNETSTRADFARVSTDTKIKRKKVFEGFLVNCYDDIYGRINGETFLLKPTPGSFVFINDYQNFTLAPEITVVIVENFENFKYIEQQKFLFTHIRKPLFVSRYWATGLPVWIAGLENECVYFGDFDLSGLKIYIQEIWNKRKTHLKTRFLIPPNIETLIEKHGNRETYLTQLENTKHIDFSQYPEISELAEIIKHHQKSLHQEFFIKKK